ncbi:MAG: hypothetical protein WCE63_02100 [Acidobacteriaceae bacterium]
MSLFIRYTHLVEEIGNKICPDWPKLGPALVIAATLVVAIRTARWAAHSPDDAKFSDVDRALDNEVDFATRIANRVLHALLRRQPGLFPQKREPIYAPGDDDSLP